MSKLPNDVQAEFDEENFGVQWRDEAPFTAVDVDHATEWMNGNEKRCRGIAGITQTDSALLRCTLSYHSRSELSVAAYMYYG